MAHQGKGPLMYTDTVDSSSTPLCKQMSCPTAVSLVGTYLKSARVGRGDEGGAVSKICMWHQAHCQRCLDIVGVRHLTMPCMQSIMRQRRERTGCVKLQGADAHATGCRVFQESKPLCTTPCKAPKPTWPNAKSALR